MAQFRNGFNDSPNSHKAKGKAVGAGVINSLADAADLHASYTAALTAFFKKKGEKDRADAVDLTAEGLDPAKAINSDGEGGGDVEA